MTYRPLLLLVLLGLLSGCAVYDRVFHPHHLGNPPMTASAKAKAKAAEKARHKGLTLGAPADGAAKPAPADGPADAGAAASSATEDTKSAADKNKAIEDMLGNTYDTKTGLLKRSRLQRFQNNGRKLHHYDLGAPSHTDATRAARHLRKHPKDKGQNPGGREAAPKETHEATDPGFAPDPTQPTAAPAPQPARAAKAPAPQPVRAAKAPAPQPTKKTTAKPKAKADRTEEERLKREKLKAGGETVDKSTKASKDKKAPKAPKPDPTQPTPGQH